MDDDRQADGDAPKSTVLVTGAAGGLGVHLVGALSEAGWHVRAFDRSPPADRRRDSLVDDVDGVDWVIGGSDTADLRRLLDGCRAVVHAAGIASLSAGDDELFATNRDLTKNLFSLACEADIDHFVYISCASVYRADTGIRTEESPTEAYNAFEESKLAAESQIHATAARHPDPPEVTILRHGLLYGPGCTTMGSAMVTLPAILRGVSRYLPGVSGGPRTNWCHIKDAASAIALVLREPDARGETFNVADETPLSFGEVLNSVIEGYEIDLGPSVRIPSLALWAVLSPLLDNDRAFERARSLLRHLWRRVQRRHDLDSPLVPRLDRDALFYVRDDSILVADKLRDLGWSPEWPDYREGIAETIRWYQNHRWAPRYDREAMAKRRNDAPSAYLRYAESIQGEFRDGDDETSVVLELEVAWPSVPWPPAGGEGLLQGRITIPGLADEAPIRGTISVRWIPLLEMEYEFGFRDVDDNACRLHGTRKFDVTTPRDSLVRLDAAIVDRYGEKIGETTARCTHGPLSTTST